MRSPSLPSRLFWALALVAILLVWATCSGEKPGSVHVDQDLRSSREKDGQDGAITDSEARLAAKGDSRRAATGVEQSPPPAPSSVLGTIVVVDEHEKEHRAESGYLTVGIAGQPGTSTTIVDIPVTQGNWDPTLVPGAKARLRGIVLRGRDAVLETERGRSLDSGVALDLRARWLADLRLHVVDGTTGEELDGLLLCRATNISGYAVVLPMGVEGIETFGREMTSPILLLPVPTKRFAGSYQVFAWRPSYAWGAIAIDQTGGGDLTLRLEPGGEVHFVLQGAPPTADTTIRLWRDGTREDLLAERSTDPQGQSAEVGRAVVGLPVGTYWVTLEKGAKDSGSILDSRALSIAPGSSADLVLKVPVYPADSRIEATVVVQLDRSWDLPSFTIMVTDKDLPANTAGRVRWIRSPGMTVVGENRFASVPMEWRTGSYELYLSEARFGAECLLTETGPREMVLTLPPRCRVSVTVLDGDTGSLVEKPTLCWAALLPTGRSAGNGCVGVPPAGPGRFEFSAPAGRILLDTSGGALERYLLDSRVVELSPGTIQEVVVDLPVGRRVVIALREGERRVDWSADAMSGFRFRTSDGPVVIRRTSLDTGSGKMTCLLKEAARYTVSFPDLAGYLPFADQEIDLTREATAEITLQLVRQ